MFMKKPYIIAHRGARSMAPENTLSAGRLAHRLGADMWEVDIRLSSDNVPVLMHDRSLARTTNVALKASYLRRFPWNTDVFSWSELSQLNAGQWFVFADPFKFLQQRELEEVRIRTYLKEKLPSLEMALSLTKELGWAINIELKEDSGCFEREQALVSSVVELINKFDMSGHCLISSFSVQCLTLLRRLAPSLTAAFLFKEMSVEEAVDICKDMTVRVLHPYGKMLTGSILSYLREEGFWINPWTINDPIIARDFMEAGATGIITDYPDHIKAAQDQGVF